MENVSVVTTLAPYSSTTAIAPVSSGDGCVRGATGLSDTQKTTLSDLRLLRLTSDVAKALGALKACHPKMSLRGKMAVVERALALGALVLAVACGGAVEEQEGLEEREATAEWCGYSFDQAIEVFDGERVCQTTVYDLETGYCTFWEPCSGL